MKLMICYLALASGVLAQSIHGQNSGLGNKIQDPRPFKAAIDALEDRFGVPINYEDPRFEATDEIIDVTDQVQNTQQRRANPNVRIKVPKGGVFVIDLIAPNATVPSRDDIQSLLIQLRSSYDAQALPGKFVVAQISTAHGSNLVVEPIAVRNKEGVWTKTPPVLDSPITIPSATRSGFETLTQIASAIGESSGFRTVIGTVPLNALAHATMNFGARREPARTALLQFLQQLGGAQALAGPSPQMGFSYRLLFDPSYRLYVLNIQSVRLKASSDKQDSASQISEGSAAGGTSPQFRKQ